MNVTLNEDGQHRLAAARNSAVGRTLTEAQFAEAWAIAGIMDDTIRATGTFRDKLTDMAHAYSRTQKFDTMKGEIILRGLYEARFGRSLNDYREQLKEREDGIDGSYAQTELEAARKVVSMIDGDDATPFYLAHDRQSARLADTLDITQAAAKRRMAEAYRSAEGRELYEDGKAAEVRSYKPEERAPANSRTEGRARRRSRAVEI
ncbi:MAG: hypothetical protein AAFN05_14385 [Pseudomonadota bacterium]